MQEKQFTGWLTKVQERRVHKRGKGGREIRSNRPVGRVLWQAALTLHTAYYTMRQ